MIHCEGDKGKFEGTIAEIGTELMSAVIAYVEQFGGSPDCILVMADVMDYIYEFLDEAVEEMDGMMEVDNVVLQ